MAKDTSCPQFCPCGEWCQILDVWRFISGMHCTKAAIVSMGKCPRVILAVALGSLRHSQRNHDWALHFDFDVRQRVEEGGLSWVPCPAGPVDRWDHCMFGSLSGLVAWQNSGAESYLVKKYVYTDLSLRNYDTSITLLQLPSLTAGPPWESRVATTGWFLVTNTLKVWPSFQSILSMLPD